MSIATNISRVRERIEAAVRRAGRDANSISLMAVSKTVPPDRIREAYDAGIRLFGENRVQEFAGKAQALGELKDSEVHMIGHLQSNKAARAAELFGGIDSVDSVRLLQKLHAAASALQRRLPVLIEINIGGETAKSGVAPESSELSRILDTAQELPAIEICGLMTVPPFDDDPEKSRPYFRAMRHLYDKVTSQNLARMRVLSMGMSHDFEVAIEEGSNRIRVGTAIFGDRKRG